MKEGIDGLLHDKTRPSRIPPLGPEVAARVVALTLAAPLVETTHWTADLMARASGISASAVRRIWKAHGLQPHRYRQFKLSNDPNFVDKLRDVVGLYVDPPAHAIVLSLMAPRPCSLRSTSSTGPSKEKITLCVCGCYGGKNHWTILPTRVFIFARREHVLHPSIGLAGPTAGGSPDVVLCPALAPFIADRLRGVLRC